MKIDKNKIDSLAQGGSISNAKSQINKFTKLYISKDGSLVFGHCQGSGKNPYICSYDFIDESNPIARCSCPSRQIPCKHALALLYAFDDGKKFEEADIPEDVLLKREKIVKRVESKEKRLDEVKDKKKSTDLTPAKIQAAKKRIQTQLDGLANAQTLARNILQSGIAGIDAVSLKNLEEQAINLGNYYINGIQTAFNNVLITLKSKDDSSFDIAIGSLIYFTTLVEKAQVFLNAKLEGDENEILKLDTTSDINELIGHIWTVESLYENDMVMENVELAQLAFYSYDNVSRKEFVEHGVFCCLNDGQIYQTINYRPYKAKKYIQSDDTKFDLIKADKMFIYPKNINPRIKIDTQRLEPMQSEIFKKIKASAKTSYNEVIKTAKGILMNPLSEKFALFMVKVSDILVLGDNNLHIVDEQGVKLLLSESCPNIDVSTLSFFANISKDLIKEQALLIAISVDLTRDIMVAKPLSIVSDDKIVRLAF